MYRVCGRLGRPHDRPDQAWSRRLDNLPATVGDWDGTRIQANEQELKASGARGAGGIAYRNRETGEVVSVFLVCGTARRVSTHTPDKCYVSHGFRMDKNPTSYEIETSAGKAQFFTAPFNKSDTISTTRLRILWSWSPDGSWIAPGTASTHKMALSKYNALFKLYVITEVNSMDQRVDETAAYRFIQEYLPELNELLFTPSAPTGPETAVAPADMSRVRSCTAVRRSGRVVSPDKMGLDTPYSGRGFRANNLRDARSCLNNVWECAA